MGDPLATLADEAVRLADAWLQGAARDQTRAERQVADRLRGVVTDDVGVRFALRFVDRVIRPESDRTAAEQLASLARGRKLPGFLSRVDAVLLRAGAVLAPRAPRLVMPVARRRMRSLVGHLVVDADPAAMDAHLRQRRSMGFGLNVNLLGEAVLGEREASRRHAEAMRLLTQPDIDYVSVKVSAVVPQLNYWAFDHCIDVVVDRLRPLFERASVTTPPTFVNLDMEEYHDLELTLAAFMRLLDEPELHAADAGIVLQAYLPDSFDALRELEAWATSRRDREVDGRPGGTVKVRLVKGANLAMERVEAAIHGWEQAPYRTKAETDANYKRCLDWVLRPERLRGLRIGLASHNLYDVAFAKLLAEDRGVADRVELEMLEGMAPAHARRLHDAGSSVLLYTPVVAARDFDVAISYLFRRLEENAAEENFIHHLLESGAGGVPDDAEASKFLTAVAERWAVDDAPRRRQDRDSPAPVPPGAGFVNEPDTDPALAANRAWMMRSIASSPGDLSAALTDDTDAVDVVVAGARSAAVAWRNQSGSGRREVLYRVADELSRRRGELISAMVHEAGKTVAEADPEVSEAVDFARWYGDRALDLETVDGAVFEPFGVVAVVPPWNFPVAIATGGVTAALAAGSAVILKPAPEVPRCGEIIAECCWAAGIPRDLLRFLRVPDNDTGRHLIAHPGVDAVILTGAYDTADLFRSWKPDLRIFAETSGKNAMIITPSADVDLAVADLVASAFGHSGQKCSAASLAILVGSAHESERLRRQLVDAVSSLPVGPAGDPATVMGPTIVEPTGKLLRGLTRLDDGERWLLAPSRIDERTWTPGVRDGVEPGSWFHQTECFGPVLGIMRADTLDEATAMQNATPYGLTGGIHSLDDDEVASWLEHVQVGNAYVNRATTGAIVGRQPFGGWKRSSIGPGAKAGGPNYVAQLGTWSDAKRRGDDEVWLRRALESDRRAWDDEFGREHDPTGLFCESNRFRYRPIEAVMIRVEPGWPEIEVVRVREAAARCGVVAHVSLAVDETDTDFVASWSRHGPERVRMLGTTTVEVRRSAADHGIHVADGPVTAAGRIELLHYLREQSVSETRHRHGNLL